MAVSMSCRRPRRGHKPQNPAKVLKVTASGIKASTTPSFQPYGTCALQARVKSLFKIVYGILQSLLTLKDDYNLVVLHKSQLLNKFPSAWSSL